MMAEPVNQFILKNEGIRSGDITIRLAKTAAEVEAVQALRYRIFYEEQDAIPSPEVAKLKRDFDSFDEVADHLIVFDESKPTLKEKLVGNYRIMRHASNEAEVEYYTEHQFNIDKLKARHENIIELGRSCVELPYRTKPILQLLWQGLAEYMLYYDIQFFIGCASFRGVNPEDYKEEFSYLHHFHLADEDIRPYTLDNENAVDMNFYPKDKIDERQAFKKLPPLVKGYLRAGSKIGEGGSIDHQWGSTDVCMVFKTGQVTDRYRKHYERKTNTLFTVDD